MPLIPAFSQRLGAQIHKAGQSPCVSLYVLSCNVDFLLGLLFEMKFYSDENSFVLPYLLIQYSEYYIYIRGHINIYGKIVEKIFD